MAGNAKSGEKIFLSKCAQCHSLDKGNGHRRQGPNLNGLFGRRFRTSPAYPYSAEHKSTAVVWEELPLQDDLLDPKKL